MAKVREVTNLLMDMADEGIMSWRAIAEAALLYMSEAEVADMAAANDLIPPDDYDGEGVDE